MNSFCNLIIIGELIVGQQRRDRLDEQCIKTLQHIFRPNTARNYRSRMNGYFRFCHFYQLRALPATEWNLIRYVRYLGNGLTSYDSLAGYLSTVKRAHELGGFEFPQNTHLLKAEMLALKRELAGPVKKAPPVTPVILSDIYKYVNLQEDLEALCYAGLVLGFCLFLRRSNLVPESEDKFNPDEQLTRGDIWQYTWLTMVDIRWSKTDQFKDRVLNLPLVPAKNKTICAVFWVKYILNRFKGGAKDPLLGYNKNGRMIPLTCEVFSRQLKSWIDKTGRNGEAYTLHGLRRAGTNQALLAGICGEDLQLMGGWRSQAYMSYIDLNLDRRVMNVVRFVKEADKMLEDADWLTKNDSLL